ncbi:hypothetical protein [Crossiella cryophila]|uniref:Tetratricopeptide (TPR) repeat protein n=1 Tax=Crossiella cryophila TaxID=43355 RepID=A0A7W7FTI0_9PSEU|nr:hypothetical protein [Crossiella cryophila]MBB4677212.1 tetratricopeptide (TPR) repeat protein [Crossiella cryophila]
MTERQPNLLLCAARERTPSTMNPDEPMSRRELADEVNRHLRKVTGKVFGLDTHAVARLERGAVRWPCDAYRLGFRHVLGVATDAELGFQRPRPRASGARPGTVSMTTRAAVPQVEEVLMSAADESARFLSWAESTNVGQFTIQDLHSDVRKVARAYLKEPTLPLFARTKALRDRAFTLLTGHQTPQQSQELYAAAGWSLTMLAWMSVDLGEVDAAETHARVAWVCAERADYNPLRAWVLATKHTAAFWQQDYLGAAGYAAEGLQYTEIGTARLYLYSALAMDLARAGDRDGAVAALRRAEQAAEVATRAENELAGPFTCSVDRAGSLWSDTELALGQASTALANADRAVAVFEATPDGQRNRGSERMVRLQQVKAHLVLGDLGSAENALAPVLETAPEHRIHPLLNRVREVDEMVTGVGGAVAGRVRDSITAFGRETVLKELTA